MNIAIRLLDKKKIAELSSWWRNIIQNHWEKSPFVYLGKAEKENVLQKYSTDSLAGFLDKTPRPFVYIMELDDRIIGTGVLDFDKDREDVLFGTDLQIDPEYQHSFFPAVFSRRVLEDICNSSINRLDHTTWPYNKDSIKGFKRCGYYWVPDTSVYMRNYLPLIFKIPEARRYFRKNDFIRTYKRELEYEPDVQESDGKKIFSYAWETKADRLSVIIDWENDKILDIALHEEKKVIVVDKEINHKKGKGIKIAVIDSGLDPAYVSTSNIVGGCCIDVNEHGKIVRTPDYPDEVGHGSACFGIIRSLVPEATFYVIKVFHRGKLHCDPRLLCEAIRHATDEKADIINLSLGTEDVYNVNLLATACEHAVKNGSIIIAAITNLNKISYPASFLNVIGVNAGDIKEGDKYYFDENAIISLIGKGNRQRVNWLDGKQILLHGTSLAAPHVTGIVARIIETYGKMDISSLYDHLKVHGMTEKVEVLTDSNSYAGISVIEKPAHSIQEKKNKYPFQKVCLYPFSKEMHSLVRFRDLLDFEIVSIADPAGKGLVGRDAGEVLGIGKTGLVIQHNLSKAWEQADTLILGHIRELSKIAGRDLLTETINKALNAGKHVFCFDQIWPDKDSEVFSLAKKVDRLLFSAILTEYPSQKTLNQYRDVKVPVPVVGVFGTSSQQGKFTTQLTLRRELLNEGYCVGQIGTEPQSDLFGFDFSLPLGYGADDVCHYEYAVDLLHYKMARCCREKKPDIFIVGAQSGIIAYDIARRDNHTLRTIAFLFGTKPDAYILSVNEIDEDSYIKNSIAALEALGKGKAILLTVSDRQKHAEERFGRTIVRQRELNKDEITDLMSRRTLF